MNGLALCSGVAGLELGLHLAMPDYRTVCFVEREAYAAATLVARMEDQALGQAPVWDDIGTFDGKPWRGVVDIVTAGIPCQPYSVAGKQEGHEDERALWPELVRVVSECLPSVVFIENVPAFLGHFRPVGEELCRLGYTVQDALFLAAEDLGAPHRRERVFILAHRDGHQWGSDGREPDPQADRGHDARGRGPRLADADQPGLEGWGLSGGRRAGECPAGAGGSELEHPQRPRRETTGTGRHQHPGAEPEAGMRDMAWPPGPNGDWSGIPEDLWPATEPGICRNSDGLAPRMERLRACGNGVVPVVAAAAFVTLMESIGQDDA